MSNQEIANLFYQLANLLEIKGENPFKIRAYKNAARFIETFPTSLEDMVNQNQDLTKLPYIGKEIAAKIEEIIKTRKLSKLEEVKKEIPESLIKLLSIEGLGPKKLGTLYKELNITNEEELKKAAKEHKISQLKGFGKKLEEKILNGLKLLKQEGFRFKYAQVEPIAKELVEYLKKSSLVLDVKVAGSFRRRKETIGDLDILCVSNSSKVVEYFTSFSKIKSVVSAGVSKASVVLQNDLQVDLRVIEKSSFGAALHYFTGSKAHVVKIRDIAIDMGLKVNEYGVFRGEELIASKNEEDIYKSLNLAYIEPELREDRGEIEAAKNGTLPNLVTLNDIKGDLHMHTTYSDGKNSIKQMADMAKSFGYEYIAISDHASVMAIVNGLDEKRAIEQIETIDMLNEEFKDFYILKSMEVDILEDGSLAMSDEILKRLDFAIAAIHFKFNLPKQEQTKRLIKAIKNPYIKIVAHPMGRLIGKRKGIELDFKEIFNVAKSEGVNLEINSQPSRLDLNDILIKEALEFNIKFAISSDAHSVSELNFIKYGLFQARRGWVQSKDIVNSLSLSDFKSLIEI